MTERNTITSDRFTAVVLLPLAIKFPFDVASHSANYFLPHHHEVTTQQLKQISLFPQRSTDSKRRDLWLQPSSKRTIKINCGTQPVWVRLWQTLQDRLVSYWVNANCAWRSKGIRKSLNDGVTKAFTVQKYGPDIKHPLLEWSTVCPIERPLGAEGIFLK